MAAYKKTSPRGADANFPKLEKRDLFQSKNQKLSGTYVFTGQDADANSAPSDTNCAISNVNACKTKLSGWQYLMQEKLVINFYGVSLSLKSPPFLSFLDV